MPSKQASSSFITSLFSMRGAGKSLGLKPYSAGIIR
jgi:hypothetical protein